LVGTNISGKNAVSIFKAELVMLGIRGIIHSGRKGHLKERVNQD
jgi:hypothetical protein